MKEFDDLKSIWQQQPVQALPEAGEVLKRIDHTRHLLSKTLLRTVMQLIPAVAVAGLIAIFVKFESPLTYAGISVIMMSVVIYGLLIFRHYRKLSKDFSMLAPADYLSEIENQYTVRKKFNQTGSLVYMLLLFSGVMLYLFEVSANMSVLMQMICFGTVTGWFLFVYFILSKKVMHNENKKFESIIEQLKHLKEQLADNASE